MFQAIIQLSALTVAVFVSANSTFGQPHSILAQNDRINSIEFAPGDKCLVAACGIFTGMLQDPRQGQLAVWNIAERRIRFRNSEHSDGVACAKYTRDGKVIASGSYDGSIKLWDAASGRNLGEIEPKIGAILAMSFSVDGARLVVGGWHGNQDSSMNQLAVIDIPNRHLVIRIEAHSDAISAVVYSSDNRKIISGSRDGTLNVWDAENYRALNSLNGHSGAVNGLALSSDGKLLAAATGDFSSDADPTKPFGALQIWNTDTWNESANCSIEDIVYAVSFLPNKKLLAIAGTSRNIQILDTAGRERALLCKDCGVVRAIAVSADGQTLASAGNDDSVKLWRIPIIDESIK